MFLDVFKIFLCVIFATFWGHFERFWDVFGNLGGVGLFQYFWMFSDISGRLWMFWDVLGMFWDVFGIFVTF